MPKFKKGDMLECVEDCPQNGSNFSPGTVYEALSDSFYSSSIGEEVVKVKNDPLGTIAFDGRFVRRFKLVDKGPW